MGKIFAAVAGVVLGYVAGVLIGAVLIELFSANRHDKGLEIAMTAAFVTGPLGAVAGLLAALLWPRWSRRRSEDN